MSSGVQGGIGPNALLHTRRNHLAAWGFSWTCFGSHISKTARLLRGTVVIDRQRHPEGEAKEEERREALKR